MKKPNAIYFRFSDYLASTHRMSLAARGAFITLCAEMLQRWQPAQHPVPFLPHDEALLMTLCGGAKNWKRVRAQVVPQFIQQDGKLFAQWVTQEVGHLQNHWNTISEKKQKTAKPLTPVPKSEWGKVKFEKDPKGQTVYYLQGRRMVGDEAFRKMCRRPGAFVFDQNSSLWMLSPVSNVEKTVRVDTTADGSFAVVYARDNTPVLLP